MRYRLGDVRLLPPVVVSTPKAAAPDKVVERPVASAAATPLLVKRDVGPKPALVDVVAVPPTRTQEVDGDHKRDNDEQRKDKL